MTTCREQGFPLTAREWYGVYLPAETTADVARRAATQAEAAVKDPALVAELTQSGVDVASSTPAMLEADTQSGRA
ncbi:tripartite tricarboxylate transporter substrate-binding protein [Variovorax sp. KK3]|uniref:tripartite tricarboxylate transporter substrate-binding protein n=1 Tax=Variovorax sp. KK3 TaxID=1855728 RepID=UPI00097C42E5|nr:tripartite tricarboxylate transporter substrate-binding protein [Variovorax sp. KK3]